MSAGPFNSPHRHHAAAPTQFGQHLQVVQGAYYVLAGLAVALFYVSLLPPTGAEEPGPAPWAVRAVALAAAGVGAALVWSGWVRRGTALPAGLGMWVALFLLAQTCAGMALGLLPMTFLADAALEGLFLALWVAVMFNRVDAQIDRAEARRTGGTEVVG